jgi:hypothetical protein
MRESLQIAKQVGNFGMGFLRSSFLRLGNKHVVEIVENGGAAFFDFNLWWAAAVGARYEQTGARKP